MESFYNQVKERLMRYAQVNTQSARVYEHCPSTECQRDLARMLEAELRRIGVQDVVYEEDVCIVRGSIPASPGAEQRPVIGLITHMDTAPDASGEGVKPWVLENYGGGDILLNPREHIVLSPADSPNLLAYIGQDLILTDGTTLLGGDDKAGIAAVMTLAQYLCEHPDVPHPPLRLAFTPDEEVSGLARDLDLERFGAEYAYTLDGDHLGWYEDETFNASEAILTVRGRSVHTGTAKGIMINAVDIAAEFMAALPANERPQYTEGVEGFFHVVSCEASCEHARVALIIRDFDEENFTRREQLIKGIAVNLGNKYGSDRISLELISQYRNMGTVLKQHPALVENLREAIRQTGLTPICEPFRGGTDGAALSLRGLPCPNLSAGYENAHGRFEYVPIQSMEKNVEILLNLCHIWAG